MESKSETPSNHSSTNEDIWEKIALGIKQSNLILCLLSQEYYNSKSCRKEVKFAVSRNKSILPDYIGTPGECDWLVIHIAELKYVRFKNSSGMLPDSEVQELLKTIQEAEIIKPSIPINVKRPPEVWSVDDIHAWFSSYKVSDTLVKLHDTQSVAEMVEYSIKLRTDSKKEFIKYEKRYAKNYPDEHLEEYIFNRFKNALLNLPTSQHETMKKPVSSSQPSKPKSRTCTIA
ncbi:unnamed protein product [Rotaria magnacalcarata]|uniref:TIR domain-containing protein n=1 Tax=Rotaria magnacalcarata TaxID=392030 RepID=A0A820L6Y6_9BILA|nr:unnamed protein product [Rotaria magnacalcarata]CAF4351509.1 unnamed protein product [Rotaria magnacalcarata]